MKTVQTHLRLMGSKRILPNNCQVLHSEPLPAVHLGAGLWRGTDKEMHFFGTGVCPYDSSLEPVESRLLGRR